MIPRSARVVISGVAGACLFGTAAYEVMDWMQGDHIPSSQVEIGNCAAKLGQVAQDVVKLDPACESFVFARSVIEEIDPLKGQVGEEHTIYHLPSASEFPEYAKKVKHATEENRNSMNNMLGATGVILGGVGCGWIGLGRNQKA